MPVDVELQAAIVDLDGTMIDTLGDFEIALGDALADLGYPRAPREFIAGAIGKGSEHLIRRVLEHAGAPPECYGATWQRYQQRYLEINGDHAPVYPGVVEGLRALRDRGLRLACVTNKPTPFVAPLLARKGLDAYFDVVFGGDAFARKKPDPLPLLEACRALGSEPARTLVIGDSSNDAAAARAAGCPVALVSYGYNHGEPVHAGLADEIVDRIDALACLRG